MPSPDLSAIILPEPPPVDGATITLGGKPITLTVTPEPANGSYTVSGGTFQMIVDPKTPAGDDLPLDAEGRMIINAGAGVDSTGRGFLPNSEVHFYLLQGSLVIDLGILTVGENGTYGGTLVIPSTVLPGTYTLQVNGLTTSNRLRADPSVQVISVSFQVVVQAPLPERKVVKTLVYFDVLSSRLSRDAKAELNRLIRRIPAGARSNKVSIVGFVGAGGSSANNTSLSRARARAVADYLRANGVRGTFFVVGAGLSSHPGANGRNASITVVPGQ